MKAGSAWVLVVALAFAPMLVAQPQGTAGPAGGPPAENSQYNQSPDPRSAPANRAAPRSDDEESSSDQTRIDLSPPKAGELAHPDGGHGANDGKEVQVWNPMRA